MITLMTNLLYILSVPKHYCECVTNNMNFNSTLMIWMLPSCKLTTCHVTVTAGIEAFLIPKNDSALAGTSRVVKDRSRKSGSIPERFVTIKSPLVVVCVLWPYHSVLEECRSRHVTWLHAQVAFKLPPARSASGDVLLSVCLSVA